MRIQVEDSEVTATGQHPFWVVEGVELGVRPAARHVEHDDNRGASLAGRWVDACDVRRGDIIFIRDVGPAKVRDVAQRYGTSAVCNLVVSALHTFAVGQSRILVHNKTTGRAAPRSGAALENANFAQKTFSQTFSAEGKFAGRTVEEVAADLKAGTLKAADVPVEYIVRDGKTLILNTRSAQALEQAGIPRSQWNAVNKTGDMGAEGRLTDQLGRNKLTSEGTPTVRPSGGK